MILVGTLVIFASVKPAIGQDDILLKENIQLLKDLINEDRTVVDALVVYPRETLIAIFETAEYPELLVRMDGMQKKTQKAFRELIDSYDREVQEGIYDMVRYDGLIEAVIASEGKSKEENTAALAAYPEEIHETAAKFAKEHLEALKELAELNATVNDAFANILSRYDEETQSAALQLVELPEVLTLLIDNMDFTVIIADVYQSAPEWVLSKADSLGTVIADQSAKELEDYQEELRKDPEAYSEMMALAEQYAKDNNVTNYKEPVNETTVTTTVVYHYPYWYGYPYWYTTPYWAPYPWYYHTGFYFGIGGGPVFIGFPSPFYVSWHYRYYPNRYYHLNNYYCAHYYRYPRSYNSFHTTVNVNVINNKTVKVDRDQIRVNSYDKGKYSREQVNNKVDKSNFDRSRPNTKDQARPVAKPEARPTTKPTDLGNKLDHITRPSTKPSQKPETRPAARPGKNPAQPTTRPATRPSPQPAKPTNRPATRPSAQPTTRPAPQPAQPTTRPAPRPTNSYQNYKGNQQHNSSWSRPSGGAARPTPNISRPSGGGRSPR